MKLRVGQQGSILLMSLFLVLVIGMVGRAVILLGPGALALSDSSLSRAQARRAAESGLEYATAKLRDRPTWRGDDNRTTVNVPGMVVIEDQGNVIGLIRDNQNGLSQFRIRFNYQDGDPGADEMPDPATQNLVNIALVSVNNLKGSEDRPIPRADEGSWSVSKPDQGTRLLSSNSVYLAVEGRAGRGMAQQPDQPNAPARGPVSRYLAEAFLELSLSELNGQASMMGGGGIAFQVSSQGKVSVEVRGNKGNTSVVPRLRSKGAVTVDAMGTPGPLHMVQGEVARDAGKPPGFDAKVEGTVSLLQENVGDGKDFFNLKWDDVVKADPDPATTKAIHIPGGTYVHWDDGSTHYYDMSLSDYQAYMASAANQNDAGVKLSPDLKEIRDPANVNANPTGLDVQGHQDIYTGAWSSSWSIKKDLYVNASTAGVQSLAVIPRSGAPFSPNDTTDSIPLAQPDNYGTQQITFDMRDAVISSDDDITLLARLNGRNATVTSAAGLKVITNEAELKNDNKGNDQGGHPKGDPADPLLEKPMLQLNLYVKKDIKISTYDNGKFKKLKLEGLVYSWGNFQAMMGDPSSDRWGDFKLSGALVAYGADPVTGSPGSAGSGQIDVIAGNADITWDDRKMAAIASLGSSTVTLRRTVYNYRQ